MFRSWAIVLLSLSVALPVLGATTKTSYTVPCTEIWPAIKVVVNDADHYKLVGMDDAQMTASYNVKHSFHGSITGALTQKTNKVALIVQGTGCEMQVESSYSGLAHDDQGDFRDRVEKAMAKLKNKPPEQPAKPPDTTK